MHLARLREQVDVGLREVEPHAAGRVPRRHAGHAGQAAVVPNDVPRPAPHADRGRVRQAERPVPVERPIEEGWHVGADLLNLIAVRVVHAVVREEHDVRVESRDRLRGDHAARRGDVLPLEAVRRAVDVHELAAVNRRLLEANDVAL